MMCVRAYVCLQAYPLLRRSLLAAAGLAHLLLKQLSLPAAWGGCSGEAEGSSSASSSGGGGTAGGQQPLCALWGRRADEAMQEILREVRAACTQKVPFGSPLDDLHGLGRGTAVDGRSFLGGGGGGGVLSAAAAARSDVRFHMQTGTQMQAGMATAIFIWLLPWPGHGLGCRRRAALGSRTALTHTAM